MSLTALFTPSVGVLANDWHKTKTQKMVVGVESPESCTQRLQADHQQRQLVRVMKLTAIILLTACLSASARGYSQRVSINAKNASLKTVFAAIEKQAGYTFMYTEDILQKASKVTVNIKDASVEEALATCFKDQPLTYTIVEKVIIVKEKSPNGNADQSPDHQITRSPIDITGKVTDENGNPLVGASVKVKNSNKGTTTNNDGVFTLKSVSDDAVLEISYVGFELLSVPVNNRTAIVTSLKQKPQNLNEVIINKGYYTEQQKFSAGNVGKVTAAEIQKQPVQNPLLALEGRVPGLVITQNSGLSGSGVTVRIQGQNSIFYGTDPLYVIDGVPFYSQLPAMGSDVVLGQSGAGLNSSQTSYGSPLSYFSPADIESIEVLKDADATAIYGSRAANGAILITTKKAKPGRLKAEVNVQTGWGDVARKIDMLNTQQYLDMRKEAFKNDGKPIPARDPNATGNFDLTIWDSTKYTDWQKELIGNTARYSDINANISGGTSLIQYVVGATYHKETTVFPLPKDFNDQKNSVHFSLNSSSSNQQFKLQFSGSYLTDDNKLPNNDITNYATRMEPNFPSLYNADGSLNWALNASGRSTIRFINPLSVLYTKYTNKTNNLLSNLNLGYKIFSNLELSSSFGYNTLISEDYTPVPIIAISPDRRNSSSRVATFGNRTLHSWVVEPQLSYNKVFKQAKINLLVGSTILQNDGKGGYINGIGYSSDDVLQNILAAPTVIVGRYFQNQYKYNAAFGRVNVNLKDKIVFNLTGRRDGSSRFGAENRFHNFGSVGGLWIFSNEKFFQGGLSNIINFGKLKASYGTTGNDQINDYNYLSLYNQLVYNGAPYQGITTLSPANMPNPHLQWEETRKLQIGLELAFADDRIGFNSSYSRNRSSNQLLGYALPVFTGFDNITANFPATIQNTSWEFYVTTKNIKAKNFHWNSEINLTIPKNKLIAFPGLETSSYAANLIIGQPINVLRLYHFLGVDPVNGQYQVDDGHGKPTTSFPNDKTATINVAPKVYGGIQNTLSYKSFELSFLFQYVNQVGLNFLYGNGPGRFSPKTSNQPTTVLNRWQKPGDITEIQRYSTSLSSSLVKASDAVYSDASFIRLKNLSASWELPGAWSRKLHLDYCRLYLQGQNLLTITKYQGLDPENQSLDYLPPLRVFTLGIRIGL